MKHPLLAAVLWLLPQLPAAAQERPRQDVAVPVPRLWFEQEFRLPDSLLRDWLPELPLRGETEAEADLRIRPAVPMSSVVVILQEYLPVGTMVLRNNTLRVGRHMILSNGQAENWAPYPAGYLDGRTISLPLP